MKIETMAQKQLITFVAYDKFYKLLRVLYIFDYNYEQVFFVCKFNYILEQYKYICCLIFCCALTRSLTEKINDC